MTSEREKGQRLQQMGVKQEVLLLPWVGRKWFKASRRYIEKGIPFFAPLLRFSIGVFLVQGARSTLTVEDRKRMTIHVFIYHDL